MTGAELNTLRKALGLPVSWVAEQAGVRQRSVNYWESGRFAVPDDVAELLIQTDKRLRERFEMRFAAVSQATYDDPFVLFRYRSDEDLWSFEPDFAPLPNSTHAMLISWLWLSYAQEQDGIKPPCIIWMEPEEYHLWLRDGNLKDSFFARSMWAASVYRRAVTKDEGRHEVD